MSYDADSIQRYAEPTWRELEDMYGTLSPEEVMEKCAHCSACIRLLELFKGFELSGRDWRERAADELGCEDCEEYM